MTPMTPTLEPGELCLSIALIHTDGTRLHPVAIKSRRTGRIAFNLAKSGTDSHHRAATIEMVDLAEVVNAIVVQRMKARCQAGDGKHRAQYSPDGRSIARLEHATIGARS
jgi:hypothetical protein